MRVDQRLAEFLREQGCTVRTVNGIWYIKTSDGKVWDMTIPMEMRENRAAAVLEEYETYPEA